MSEILHDQGYQLIEVHNGPAVLRYLASNIRIDVGEVGLPGLKGRELADADQQHLPDLKVLLMIGYVEYAALAGGFLELSVEGITKLFAADDIAARICERMGQA